MNLDTRQRLLDAGLRLFADHGFRGASVRDLCNLARANPGAVSYHFGGKRQLYRAVLRHAAATLAGPAHDDGADSATIDPHRVVAMLLARLEEHRGLARLLLRDLADGGEMSVEALVPPVRAAFGSLATSLGESDTLRPGSESRELFLTYAAPIVLAGATSSLLRQVLDVNDQELAALLLQMISRADSRPSGRSSLA